MVSITKTMVAMTYLLTNRKEEAEAMFKESKESDPKLPEKSPPAFAAWHLLSGNSDQTFAFLDKAYETRDPWLRS